MAQLTLNNGTLLITEETSFYVNYERHPNLFLIPKESPQAITILKNIRELKKSI